MPNASQSSCSFRHAERKNNRYLFTLIVNFHGSDGCAVVTPSCKPFNQFGRDVELSIDEWGSRDIEGGGREHGENSIVEPRATKCGGKRQKFTCGGGVCMCVWWGSGNLNRKPLFCVSMSSPSSIIRKNGGDNGNAPSWFYFASEIFSNSGNN